MRNVHGVIMSLLYVYHVNEETRSIIDVSESEVAFAILGIPPKEWIPIIISLVGIIATIAGVFITIRKLSTDIKLERVKLERENQTVLSNKSKEHYAKLRQLLHELINEIKVAVAYSKRHELEFAVDPSISCDNNLFKSYVFQVNVTTADKIEDYRKGIFEKYEKIRKHNENAPVHNISVDSRMAELVEHMMQALKIENERELLDNYEYICTAPFPTIEKLEKLENDINVMLFSYPTES